MILNYEPLSRAFQDVGQAIRVGDLGLSRIDVSVPGVLSHRDLPPIELPLQRSPREIATSMEETASSRLSLEVEINQFRFEEEGEVPERPVEPSNSEAELDRFSAANSPKLVIAWVNTSSEEEEEMALNPMRGLKELVAERNKGTSSKEALQT